MAKALTEYKLNRILRDYILELTISGEYIPEWLFDARFLYDEYLNDCVAQLNAETNCIVYGKNTSTHAILHELEHLRSRHNELVKGYDDELEKIVYFYFVGYRTSGGNGLFLEEALNELSARKMQMRMFGGSKKSRIRLLNEYKAEKYYNFEIYMTFGLCSLLGLKVDDVTKLKFTRDTTGQDSLRQIVDFMAGDERYWIRLQEPLDDYEMAKRMPMSLESRRDMQKERLFEYYKLAYGLIVLAHNRKIISTAEAGRAIYLFEEYGKKAGSYFKYAEAMRQKAKVRVMSRDKSIEKLFANSERCVVQSEDKKQFAVILPRGSNTVPFKVAKAFFESRGKIFAKTDKYELLQEDMYGLEIL